MSDKPRVLHSSFSSFMVQSSNGPSSSFSSTGVAATWDSLAGTSSTAFLPFYVNPIDSHSSLSSLTVQSSRGPSSSVSMDTSPSLDMPGAILSIGTGSAEVCSTGFLQLECLPLQILLLEILQLAFFLAGYRPVEAPQPRLLVLVFLQLVFLQQEMH